ncbi:MAG: ABC transporter substrate-binding protein [Halothiobacillus sp.]
MAINKIKLDTNVDTVRRQLLKAVGAVSALYAVGAISPALAETEPKIRVGYWPIAAGLPFYVAIDRGFFKEAGLDVEAVRFAGPTQVVEAMIAGRVEGSAHGTASAALAVGEIVSPGLLKIFSANGSNEEYVLDEYIVAINSPLKAISELKGKRVGCGPGIQNITLAKAVLQKNGVTDAKIIEIPIGQHIAAIAAGQIDAAYTLEPTGTIGRLKGATRIIEVGVISKYVLGDPKAPWFGGAASLTTAFITKNPDVTKKYIAAYARGIEFVRNHPDDARQYLKGYTAIEGPLTAEVPLIEYTSYNEFTKYDIEMFQKFYDLFWDKKIFSTRVLVEPLIYKQD